MENYMMDGEALSTVPWYVSVVFYENDKNATLLSQIPYSIPFIDFIIIYFWLD